MSFKLGEDSLTTSELVRLASKLNPDLIVSDSARTRLNEFRMLVDSKVEGKETVYGINTGFGYLSNVRIEREKLDQLQVNIIRSHACGVGDLVSPEISRACLILRAHTFLLGNSGIHEDVLDTVLKCIEKDVLPAIPCQGSVGASGDLAPLAHLALGLMGEGEVHYGGDLVQASDALAKAGIAPIKPRAKEGLSLINGTHFMTSIAAFALEEAKNLTFTADIAAAMSLDAIRGTNVVFDERIHNARGQEGQKTSAAYFRRLIPQRSEIMGSHDGCERVQDPYSFRCAAQVHGATRDTVDHVQKVVDRELNAVSDNPLVFENGDILSGGNFHGQPIALVMDFLGIAVAELANISERRIEKITNPSFNGGLPPFAAKESGLNSGYMIPHVVAASLVSENKIYTHPASVDSIPTSADKEDHVSMGPIAARKARRINVNVRQVLAIELLAACQGLDLIEELKTTPPLEKIREEVRKKAPKMDVDRSLHKEIIAISNWIQQYGPIKTIESLGVRVH